MLKFVKIYVTLHLILVGVVCALANTDCSGYLSAYPTHYCECTNNANRVGYLPFDVQVTDSVWLKSRSSVFLDGFTAYLYSDCDVNFDIYQNCTSKEPLYSVVIPKNQARDVTAESIKQKLDDAGMLSGNIAISICIYPVGGTGGRLMCYPYNTGYNSTCSDILALLPGMTFVSSHAQDVYEILPENISDSYEMYLQWGGDKGVSCQLSITRGSCDGAVVAEYDFEDGNSLFCFDPELLRDVRTKGESLFAHFTHANSTVGRISFNEAAYVEHLTDTVICRGKEFKYQDYVTTEAGVYHYDTVKLSVVEYAVYGYNVIFTEPELVYDTLALKIADLPYNYRGQYVVNSFGDYDVMIHNDGECDERMMLNVRRNFAVVEVDRDTTLCHGKTFEYNGKNYVHDEVFVDSIWNKEYDTLFVNTLNLYFSAVEPVYDTLAYTKKEFGDGFRYEGMIIREYGDYSTTIYDAYGCQNTLHLHVRHKVIDVAQTIDTTLCGGDIYKHTDGAEYVADVTIVDTIWRDEDTRVITTTNVHFITNGLAYDTLYLGYSDLPYLYENQAQITQLKDTTVDVLVGKCLGQVQLHLVHKFATVVVEKDTTLCKGKAYEHNGVAYFESVAIVDSMWLDRDTFQIATMRVYFTTPETQYDTLALRTTDLPYNYRGEQIADFGEYDLIIREVGECDEHVLLNVLHFTTTITEEQDTTLCKGKAYEYNGVTYFDAVDIIDSLWINRDTLLIETIYVHFVASETQYDTLALKTSELPYNYKGEQIADFGTYEITINNKGECDERYSLYVYHDIDTILTVKDTIICYGGIYRYEIDGKKYNAKTDISFGSQQILNADTVLIDSLYVRFALEPDLVFDTLILQVSQLPYQYHTQSIKEYKDYEWTNFTNTTTGCKEHRYLRVAQLTQQTIDTTICEGDVYVYDGVEYTQPTTLIDSAWVNDFNYQITTIRVNFRAIETQYDTLALRAADLPYDYRGEQITGFGQYDLTIENIGVCDEHILLNVVHLTTTITTEQDTTLCEGKAFEHNGVLYNEPTTIVDSAWVNQDTFQITTTRVHFVALETQYDTLALRTTDLPYDYRGVPIADFGEYNLTIHNAGDCDEHILLSVEHLTVTITEERDTTLCEGKIYEHNGSSYFEPTTIVDSVWMNQDTLLIATTNLHFVMPDVEYDTIFVTAAELQTGYYYELADAYIYTEGVYDYEITADDECTRKISLTVIKDISSTVDNISVSSQSKLIMIDGVIYIFYKEEYYTLMGEKVNISKIE